MSQASADDSIVLAGPGTGTVSGGSGANPPNEFDCTNVGNPGSSGTGTCSAFFPPAGFPPPQVFLTASPAAGSFFTDWNGDAFTGAGLTATCNSGTANPCHYFTTESSGFAPTTITATFDCSTFSVATGASAAGEEDWLRTLEGQVDADGCSVEESYFEYGLTTDYGSTTPTQPSGSELSETTGAEAVSAETAPLEPDATYHYRLVVSNAGGTVKGQDRTFTTGAIPSSGCPNEARREEQGIAALLLPACMALEQVSPPLKASVPAFHPNVSSDGSRVSFYAQGALDVDPPSLISKTTYVASRGTSGWASESTLPAVDPYLTKVWRGSGSDRRPSFTPDFSNWFVIGATAQQEQQAIFSVYEAGLGGSLRSLAKPLEPLSFVAPGGADRPELVVLETSFQGASADHTHLYFRPGRNATYFPGDPIPFGAGTESNGNVYLASVSSDGQPNEVELLQRDRIGKVWGGECGARLGGIGPSNGERNQGAVSADGQRTYLSARAAQPLEGDCDPGENKLRILQRLETSAGPTIAPLFASECSRPATDPCSGIDGEDLYQGASVDQSKVYFTTNRQLADSDLDEGSKCSGLEPLLGCDLYLYDRSRPAGERLVQVSAGEDATPGDGARVFNGVTAISADGSHVYFVAGGVLTEDENPAGEEASAFQPNLYLWDAGSEEISFVATLAGAVSFADLGDTIFPEGGANGLWGGAGTWRNNAYPVPATGEGHTLLFETKAALAPEDGDGRRLDVYRYDSNATPETLDCLSCAPGSSEASPDEAPFDVDNRGEAGVPLGTDFAEWRRWASEDGETVGFLTAQSLLPGDVDEEIDGYLWREGKLARLPGAPFGGDVGEVGPFLDHSGSTVAFQTAEQLLPSDGDSTGDVYVARIGGGFPFAEVEDPCDPGEDCAEEGEEAPAPTPLAPAALPGNVAPNPCARRARKAQGLSKRAKRGRRNARRLASNGKRGQARKLHRRAGRLAKRARRTSNGAKRCRKARQRANTDRRAGK